MRGGCSKLITVFANTIEEGMSNAASKQGSKLNSEQKKTKRKNEEVREGKYTKGGKGTEWNRMLYLL